MNKHPNDKFSGKGFTLLELLIVIIIIGVLASFAVTRFFSMVEYSRSMEAFISIRTINGSMERCYLTTGDYGLCYMNSPGPNPNNLDITDPGAQGAAHFSYRVNAMGNPFKFRITATRNALDNGAVGDTIMFRYYESGQIDKSGTGAFTAVK
jgi:prepilin-type N-terminal cleavage/methylation domain-containing protein